MNALDSPAPRSACVEALRPCSGQVLSDTLERIAFMGELRKSIPQGAQPLFRIECGSFPMPDLSMRRRWPRWNGLRIRARPGLCPGLARTSSVP